MLDKTSLILLLLISLTRAEDSLQSALNAVNRKQRDLSNHQFGEKDGSYYGYSGDNNEDLAFLVPEHGQKIKLDNLELERALYEYLEDKGFMDENTPVSSSFRERMESDRNGNKVRQDSTRTKSNNQDDDSEYDELIQRVYDTYGNIDENYDNNNKRAFYNNLGWDSVGMKKRSRYFQPDVPNDPSTYLLNYSLRDEMYNRLGADNNANSDWNLVNREEKSHPYIRKRFPVSKRTYFPPLYQNDITHQQKRSTIKEAPKTDPKTERDLSMIFNPNHKLHKVPTNAPKKATLSIVKKIKIKDEVNSKEKIQLSIQNNSPIEVKKKSVNWSDYFGLDRRKKSKTDVDNDWSLNRYREVMGVPNKRIDQEYPLQYFHKNEAKKESESTMQAETKMKLLDGKLKDIEDTIVDEALKITGATEGAVDSKQVQEAKNKIINRLAAAYRLEKMRRALNEYRMSLKKGNKINEGEDTVFEKRVAVPRKQAIEKMVEEDNSIKCTTGDENCDDVNYKTAGELLERANWDKNGCPKIERACKDVSVSTEPYQRVFETACFFYQMCLQCAGNSWFSPVHQCNILFLSKATDLCDGDEDCRKVARQSVKYLMHANRSVRDDPYNGCDVDCPDKR